MIGRKMNVIEIEVLNLIVNRASFEEPITALDIRKETGLSKRMLEQVIESLRVNFRHPIVAKKFKPNGYYLPKNEEERQAGASTVQTANPNRAKELVHRYGSGFREVLEVRA